MVAADIERRELTVRTSGRLGGLAGGRPAPLGR
jgi:hypothetical protein